ncbi:hypothetical protein WA026_005492 [Henosepilachna vigintioctopunctata]|uniref:Programmed cell death protein 7 n=1 Tax=Henosepilachna vigintioctopunctata TaxID=420089 RepID=A0AAW1U2A1_9CUCU
MNNSINNYNTNLRSADLVGQSETYPLNYQFHSNTASSDFTFSSFNFSSAKPSGMSVSAEPWIEQWLMKIGKNNHSLKVGSNEPKISISSARKSIKICLDTLSKLDAISEDLKSNVQKLSSAEWKKKTVKIGHLKETFNNVLNNLNNPENVKALQRAVHQRKKKRANQKRKRIEKQISLKKEKEEHINLNKQIDRWLDVKKEEDDKVKTEETMNKDIDCVLSEVNKKKLDAKKNLSLIRALIKLRNIRETVRVQRGEKTSLEDKHAFATTTEKMLKIWENALKQYNTEEHMLKTMLEKTASENLKHKELLKEKQTLFMWEKVIFGDKTIASAQNASFIALTAAERDMETFIAIRRSWDTFLVNEPQGSSLPIGWVLPPNEASKDWKKFLPQ